ncbi:EAL domain-containing response regulator [Pseudomonas costantinii]|uniref:EAL domain-containing response regulator n=1 Tax=Pseudomonas costantinii TaxID=168469 RepID=UPI0015A2DAD8|nr:EAL domain-containing response regulator [Pseudomonas costantinii]NVZ69146.1 EAL domain-containing response regulator [Pseudomonas costantinii]
MSTSSITFLVLEEHAFQRSIALLLLEQLGDFSVLSASNIKQALGILQRGQRVDILLCDLRMDSIESLLFLRQAGQTHHVRSLILSSSFDVDLQQAVEALVPQLGMVLVGTLAKPLQREALSQLLMLYQRQSVVGAPRFPATALASELEVRRALIDGQIQPFFQPKFNLSSNEVEGVEVLARWCHPQRGVLPPALFLPVIERSGLLNDLLFSQLHRGLALQKKLKGRGHVLSFAYNLEAEQLAEPWLITRLVAVLKSHGMPASGITFELTERGPIEPGSVQQQSLVSLRMLGCRLSIDDFGTGFSNLQRLYQAPFNEIKLDASLVRNVVQDAKCQSIVTAVITLGRALGISVVLEGIETQAQRQALIELGGITGQGYLCARPMSTSDLLDWVCVGDYPKVNGL